MTAYLREVIDVAAVIVADEYNERLFNETRETLNFQKYAVGQTIQWVGGFDGLLDEIELPHILLVGGGCLLTPTMLEKTYSLLCQTDADAIRTKCLEGEHPDYYLGHSLIRTEALFREEDPDVVDVDLIGAICGV